MDHKYEGQVEGELEKQENNCTWISPQIVYGSLKSKNPFQ